MKYIILCLAALAVCIGLGWLTSKFLIKKHTRIFTCFFTIVFTLAVTLGYMSVHYSADDDAIKALEGNDKVAVEKIDGGYYYNGAGSDKALVFYPGAKVECEAYAPLMLKISEEGVDCFLVDMPFNFAIFGINKAEGFVENYSYETWIMAGHSLGGIAASSFAEKNQDKVKGVVLLASYPTKEISENIGLLSIFGSNDGCLDEEQYEANRENWPISSKEYVIKGGNHANFGNYGLQKGDKESSITRNQQQREAAKAIAAFWQ